MSEDLIEKAKREAEEFQRKVDAQKQESEKTDINVTIDTRDIEKKLIEKSELEAQIKTGIAVSVGQKAIERLKAKADELNVEYSEENFKSVEDFEALAYVVAQRQREQNRKAPSGSIPLSPAQTGNQESSEGFNSYEDMIQYLQDEASKGGSLGSGSENEAQKILTQLWKNMLTTQREYKQNFEYERTSDTPLAKELAEKFRRRKGIKKGED